MIGVTTANEINHHHLGNRHPAAAPRTTPSAAATTPSSAATMPAPPAVTIAARGLESLDLAGCI
jgi:hypothetical protein